MLSVKHTRTEKKGDSLRNPPVLYSLRFVAPPGSAPGFPWFQHGVLTTRRWGARAAGRSRPIWKSVGALNQTKPDQTLLPGVFHFTAHTLLSRNRAARPPPGANPAGRCHHRRCVMESSVYLWPTRGVPHAAGEVTVADNFEIYARGKIAALRAEADQLERVLLDYLSQRGRGVPVAPIAAPQMGQLALEPRRRGNSPFGKVMEAIRAAGSGGMSLDEMAAVAERDGTPIPRNTLRSQVWNEKAKGRLIPLDLGRYAVPDILPVSDEPPGPIQISSNEP